MHAASGEQSASMRHAPFRAQQRCFLLGDPLLYIPSCAAVQRPHRILADAALHIVLLLKYGGWGGIHCSRRESAAFEERRPQSSFVYATVTREHAAARPEYAPQPTHPRRRRRCSLVLVSARPTAAQAMVLRLAAKNSAQHGTARI